MTEAERNAWLAGTAEAALEPGLPLCDPHHHLWDYPTSRYLLAEFLADLAGGHRVERTVFVECAQFYDAEAPAALQPVGETRYIDGVAGAHAIPGGTVEVAAGIVGFADLSLGSAVQPVLEAHIEASDLFRGIRHATAWHESERIHNAHTNPTPGLMGDAQFREGIACLQRLGLSFDAWLYHAQLPELVDLAQAFPGLDIVLDHMAGPLGIGPYAGRREETFDAWRRGMAALAGCENVFVKIGGRTMSSAGFGWHRREAPPGSEELAQAMAPCVHATIDLFGPGRCMFESNFPVDRASCSYTVLWNAFKRVSRRYAPAERAALLHDTACRVYRLGRST